MHAQFGIHLTSRPRETTCTVPECMYVSLCMYLFSGTLSNKSQILDLFDLYFFSSDEVGFPSLLSPSG